jgi:hypothetical protein
VLTREYVPNFEETHCVHLQQQAFFFLSSNSWLTNYFLELLDPENLSHKFFRSTGKYLPVDKS